jgi:RND family efflux transporter MFP subunit
MGNKKVLRAAFIAGLIALLSLSVIGFVHRTRGEGLSKHAWKTVKVETVKTGGEVTVSGTVIAKETAVVSSRISGYVKSLKVDAGDHVKAGQELLSIDTTELEDQKAQAEASLESAKADLANAKVNLDRYKPLFKSRAISKQQFDEIQTHYDVALAAEQRASAALDQVKTQLTYGTVTAPFAGIIGSRTVNVGDLAMPGQPLLTVYMPGTLELVVPVAEQFARYVKEGTHVEVNVPSLGMKQSTSIREVVPQTNEQTKTITVKAPLSDAPGLSPGIYGTLTFDTLTSEVTAVPQQAVQTVGQLQSVRVLKDGQVETRYVTTGRRLKGGKIEILSGLKPGERVVME